MFSLTDAVSSREQVWQTLYHSLRPGQQRMADWQGGALAVSAVPGAGKSTGMAIATALLLARRYQTAAAETMPLTVPVINGQIVLVTFTRSAVANLKGKIRKYLKALGLPMQGFVVYTLHGLALNIATRHPELSGLDLSRLTLVSPNQSHRLIRSAVEQWIGGHPRVYQRLLEGRQFDGEETERLRRQSVLRTEVLPELAYTVIHEAKSSGLFPNTLRELEDFIPQNSEIEAYGILSIAAGLYERYQQLLQQRGFIDYDDMILAALRVLDHPIARQHWQSQVYAVFEDEAQDSSPLQTRLLEILAASPYSNDRLHHDEKQLSHNQNELDNDRSNAAQQRILQNLIRVGDPNQAINSTFTPADPSFFRDFCAICETQGQLAEMDQAGRSTAIIIAAANFMLDWVNQRYGKGETRATQALTPFRPQTIHPVPSDDPQPDANPEPTGAGLEIRFPPDIYQEINLLAQRIASIMSIEQSLDPIDRLDLPRAAILVRENRQGRFIADLLQHPGQHGIEVDLSALGITIYDVGERDRHSHVPAEILALLQFLDRPHSPDYLKAALDVLVSRRLIPTQDLNLLASQPEQFLYPGPLDPPQPDPVLQARRYCTSLLRARQELPQYQLIPFLALTLQYDQAELATADKLADRIAQQTSFQQTLAAVLEVLGEIVRSERFEPIETDEPEARYTRPGQVTIITMHKAKGLDWDFVFLPFLHDHLIPGTLHVLPQAQFLGDFTLAEVARAQIRAYIHQNSAPQTTQQNSHLPSQTTDPLFQTTDPLFQTTDPLPDTIAAWERAASLKTAEEFRLLYVAMTRARRLLWLSAARKAPFTWSKPENLDDRLPCPVLPALCQRFGGNGVRG